MPGVTGSAGSYAASPPPPPPPCEPEVVLAEPPPPPPPVAAHATDVTPGGHVHVYAPPVLNVAVSGTVATGYSAMVMRKLEQATVFPDVIDNVFKFRSLLLVPHKPVATIVVPFDCNRAKYPAVPVFPAVPDVIEFAVAVTTPPDAVAVGNAVALKVRLASCVPVTAPFTAGCDPV